LAQSILARFIAESPYRVAIGGKQQTVPSAVAVQAMQETHSKSRTMWLKCCAFLAIFGSYLFFAPNYDWTQQSSDTPYGADFLQEWVGARMVVTGNVSHLYDVDMFRAWQHDPSIVGFEWASDQYFPPVYPPPHYVLFSPLACIPYRWAALVWLASLIVAAFGSAKLIVDIATHHAANLGADEWRDTNVKTEYLWIAMLLFPSLFFSITLGQKSVYWLLIVCMTWRLLQSHRDYSAGMVFGLLSIKPTLFFLFPLVMLRNLRWRFFVGSSLSVCTIWGATACFVPMDTWLAFVGSGLQSVGSYAENSGYRLDWSCNLMTMAYSVPAEAMQWCKWAICLPLAIYLLYCVFEDKSYTVESPEKALMLLATTLLISPHTYHYDLCVLLLPILWLVATTPKYGFAYYGMLAVGLAVAPQMQEYLQIPIVPILLIGMVCELRLRGLIPSLNQVRKVEPKISSSLF
jgi:hypothetical protein